MVEQRDGIPAGKRVAIRPAARAGQVTLSGVLTLGIVLAALAVGLFALFQLGNSTDSPVVSADRFGLDLSAQMAIPDELLGYAEVRRIDVALQTPRILAVSPRGTVYVAGDADLEIHAADAAARRVALGGSVTCLAVGAGAAGDAAEACRLYAGLGRQIVVLDEQGEVQQQWPTLEPPSLLTGLAVLGDEVFAADAGQRVVWRFDSAGRKQGSIGRADPDRQMPGFVIPSPYFDLVLDQDEVLHVANPGMRRVESYNLQGELQSFWGRASAALPDFFGCCNPAHLALLPDGRFVTSEKGIPRVKVYSPAGELQYVVAGPQQLGVSEAALGDARGDVAERVYDVAVDTTGRVYVLDPHRRQVILFEVRIREERSES